MAIKEALGKFGSRFAFEFFLETIHDTIIQGLKKYLVSIRAEDIPGMVEKGQFPPIDSLNFGAVSSNLEHLEKISLLRLMEFIVEARPDLASAIQDKGEAGAIYMVKLRQRILQRMKQAEFKPEENVVLAVCDQCGKKFPIKRDEISSITKCPFCEAGAKETKEPPAQEE